MSDPTSVFTDQPTETDPSQTQQPSQTNVFADQLAQIKNEKGEQKYSSVEDALKGAANAQEFIAQLKAEKEAERKRIEELESKVSTMSNFEKQLAELKALQDRGSKEQETPVQSNTAGNTEDLASLVQKEIAKLQSQEQQSKLEKQYADNELLVSNKLVESYGSKAGEMLRNKAQELGVSVEDLQEQSRKSPSIVLALFNQSGGSTKAPSTSSFVPKQTAPDLPTPKKSLLKGATSKEQTDFLSEIKAAVYKKHGITSY